MTDWTDLRDAQATFRRNVAAVDRFLASFRAWMRHQDQQHAYRQRTFAEAMAHMRPTAPADLHS